MERALENINKGFERKDSYLIYKSLIDLLKHNNDMYFQKHPLGFMFLNLGKISNHVEFRLHVWDSKFVPQDNELQIHNHSFDFESFVIKGRIKNTIYIIKENIDSNGILYQVKFVDNKSILDIKGDKFCIEIDSEKLIEEGCFYDLKKDDFHKSDNMLDFSITILKMAKPQVFNSPLIFSSKKINALRAFSRSKLNKDKNFEILSQVIRVCEDVTYTNKN
jgi:hypothetical protein